MKPTIFLGSSSEQLDIVYALQENLEHDAEPTVWTQGIFNHTKSTLESLVDLLAEFDFAAFVLAPDDITLIRDFESRTVRDNVIFELGLFIGRLGRSRTFLVVPRGTKDLHLPSDLLGITPTTYEPNRQDGNLVASLGPSANRIRRSIKEYGQIAQANTKTIEPKETSLFDANFDDNDFISILESWMGSRRMNLNTQVIRFAEVDSELRLPPNTCEKFIEIAAKKWNYITVRKGNQTILFENIDMGLPF